MLLRVARVVLLLLRYYIWALISYHLLSLLLLSTVPPAIARSVNTTVDDQGSDPLTRAQIIYDHGWVQGSLCMTCWAKPDVRQTYNGTWHDATYNRGPDDPYGTKRQTASFTFTGASLVDV